MCLAEGHRWVGATGWHRNMMKLYDNMCKVLHLEISTDSKMSQHEPALAAKMDNSILGCTKHRQKIQGCDYHSTWHLLDHIWNITYSFRLRFSTKKCSVNKMKWVQQRDTKTVGGQDTMNINWNKKFLSGYKKTFFTTKTVNHWSGFSREALQSSSL